MGAQKVCATGFRFKKQLQSMHAHSLLSTRSDRNVLNIMRSFMGLQMTCLLAS